MDTSILTRRIGPLPGWAWGGLIAVAAWWFLLRGRSATPSPSSSSGTASGSNSVYGLGYAQGLQAASAGRPAAAASSSTTLPQPLWQFGQPPSDRTSYVWRLTDAGYQGNPGFPRGQVYPGTNATQPSSPQYGWQWAPVPAGYSADSYAGALLQGGVGGGAGGTARKHAVGARSRAPIWHDAHPAIGAPVRYAHYVRAVGGPGNHQREIGRVAQQSGVHPARVAMLNPFYTGRIRVA